MCVWFHCVNIVRCTFEWEKGGWQWRWRWWRYDTYGQPTISTLPCAPTLTSHLHRSLQPKYFRWQLTVRSQSECLRTCQHDITPFGTNCHINITGRKHAFVIVTKSNLFSFSLFLASQCPPQCIGGVIPSEDFASITSWFLFNHSMFVHSVSNVECQASFTWPCRRLNWPSQIIINGGVFFFRVGMF